MNLPSISYEEGIRRLYDLEFSGMKLGLDTIKALMDSLGDPHRAFPTIHVAGTNGKGSVSNMLSAALQANGYKTGLFTSPHLINYTERMKIDGIPITEDRLTEYFKLVWPAIQTVGATFFEATTAIAFAYFRDEDVDVAVIETGLGGRLDATNILEKPLATVVTSIGLDHTEILGDTLEKIAAEKAGIFKAGVPAIVNASWETHEVFIEKAKEVGAPLHIVSANDEVPKHFALAGEHQLDNLATVQETLRHISLRLDDKRSREGIANTAKLTGFRGRLEEFPYEPARRKDMRLILDVAHNAHAFERLRDHFLYHQVRPIVIAGFAKDKDLSACLEVIQSFAGRFVAVSARMSRAMPVDVLFARSLQAGLDASKYPNVIDAVNDVISISKPGSTILLTGSHYVVGEFLACLKND